MNAISTGLNETARMFGERLALTPVLQVYVAVQNPACPWDDANFGCDPVDLGEKPGCAFAVVANMARLGPPAGPAIAIHRPEKGVDALDAARPQAVGQGSDLGSCWILVHPVPAHPQGVVAFVEHPSLHLGGSCCGGDDDAHARGQDAKGAQQHTDGRHPFRTAHSPLLEACATPCLAQRASIWTRASCASTLELINFSAVSRFRLEAG